MTLFRNKKREYMAFLKVLVKVLGAFGLGTILLSCGTSPGYSYTISGTVSAMIGSGLVLQNNGGDDLSISANGAFSFKTSLTDGSAYSVTVKTQPASPSQVCTISNESGTINSGPVSNIVVNCSMNSTEVTIDPTTTDTFVYVSLYSYTSNNVSAYKIDKTTGALINNTKATAGTNPNPVKVATVGSTQYAYVSNIKSGTVSAFSIDPTTGALTLVPDTNNPYTAGTYPNPVTVATVNGKQYAYVSNMGSNNIYVYSIDPTTGALTAVGSPFATQTSPANVVIDTISSTGTFAYVPNVTSDAISVYTIDQSTGALIALQTVTTGTYPMFFTVVTINSTTQFAYAANMGSGTISVYSIDQTTGALTAVETESAGTYPMSFTVDSSNQYAYVSNVGSATISVYTIDQTTGALTASTTTPTVTTGSFPNPVTIAMIGSNRFAYVSNKGSDNIYVYAIGTDGSLSYRQTMATGNSPNPVKIDTSGQYAYVSSAGDGGIYAYTIDQTATALAGQLTAVPGSPF